MNRDREPHVVIAPAMGVPARFYAPLVESFSSSGATAEVVGRRGVEAGLPAPARGRDWSYAEETADLAAAVRRARAADSQRSVLVVGHSLGAQLCALLAIDQRWADDRPDGFVSVAGSVPWFGHYGRRGLSMWWIGAAVPVVTAVLGYWPKQGFGGPAARTLMREWARMVRTGRMPAPAAVAEQDVPLFAVRLDGDHLVTARAAGALEDCFTGPPRTVWTYTGADCPTGGSIDHLRWVRTPQPVVDRIRDWWSGQLGERNPRRTVSTTPATMPSAAAPIIEA